MKHIARLRNKNSYWQLVGSQAVQNICDRIDKAYLIQEINNKQQQQKRIFFTQCNFNLLHKFIYIA